VVIDLRLTTFALAGIISFGGILAFRSLSTARGWLDLPNDRSSHTEPTPRGAGAVIAVVCLTIFASLFLLIDVWFSLAYLICASAIAVIGWLDDIYQLPISLKFIAQLVICAGTVFFLGHWSSVGISAKYSIDLIWLGPIITVIWVLWSVNAFNFIDGIDGLAGLQGMIAAIAWSFIFGASGSGVVFAGTAGACFGFLILNWEPAKIFMGDVGSSFLGYSLAVLPIAFANRSGSITPILPVVSILLLWPVNFDAGWTRLARALRGERFWRPHRQHFYQVLADIGFSHSFISMLYGALAVAAVTAAFIFMYGTSKLALIPIAGLGIVSIALSMLVHQSKKKPSNVAG
jgi:Fuc2NAc and GlcNAc transferase